MTGARLYTRPLSEKSIHLGKRLAAVITGIASALAFLELATRVVTAWRATDLDAIRNRPPPTPGGELQLGDIIRPHRDDRIVYELRPGVRGRFLGQELSINSLGMRGPERQLDKSAGTFRIVGLGDSVMFGWGVAEEETYLAIFERTLRARFPERRFEVWNLAVPGYNSVQEVENFAEQADRLDPNLVLIGWVGNDMDLPNFLVERPNPWALDRWFFGEIAARRMGLLGSVRRQSGALFEVPRDEHSKRLLFDAKEIPARYRPLVGWDNMIAAFRRLAAMAKARGIPAVALFDSGPRDLKALCAADGFVIVESQHGVLRYEKQHAVDRYTALRISRTDTHPNALGHQVIADTLLESLLRTHVLDARGEHGP
jgi:lysophospholipase L1-like esterase